MVLAKLKPCSLLFLRKADCTKYTYDVFGNRISANEDADGAGAGSAVMTHFALEGSKVKQNAWQEKASFTNTENWDIWADLDGSNNLKTRYVRGNAVDELFARVSSAGTAAWYYTDRMGSVRQMVDASGTVQDTIAYDGFGNITSESSPTFGDQYKWTGREYNSITRLLYNRARFYNEQAGQWVNEDPIGQSAGDYNLSRYVFNSALFYTDPSGLDDKEKQKERARDAIEIERDKEVELCVKMIVDFKAVLALVDKGKIVPHRTNQDNGNGITFKDVDNMKKSIPLLEKDIIRINTAAYYVKKLFDLLYDILPDGKQRVEEEEEPPVKKK